MITLGDVILKIRGDTADGEAAIRRFDGVARQTASGIAGFFRQALAFATGGLIQQAITGIASSLASLPGNAISAVGSIEMMEASVSALIGKELVYAGVATDFNDALAQAGPIARDTLSWLQRLALQSPFESDQVQSAFQLAAGYGFVASATSSVSDAQEKGIVTAQRLTEAMLNQVAATGATPDTMNRIALSLGQIKANSRVSTEELNQLAEAGVGVRQVLATAFTDGDTAKLMQYIERGLIPADEAILAIVEDMEIMSGAAAQMGNTWTGLIASLSDLGQSTIRTLFRPALDQLKPLVQGLVSALQSDAVVGAMTRIGEGLGSLVGGAVQNLTNALTLMAAGWQRIQPIVSEVGITIQAFGLIAGAIIGQAASWGSALIAPFAQAASAIGSNVGSIVASVEGGFSNLPGVVGAILNRIPAIASSLFTSLSGRARQWGMGWVATFAEGIASGIGYVTSALSSIANTVAYWLTPHSPPPLLPDLDVWGAGAAKAWLEGWGDADFSALQAFGQQTESLIATLTKSGQLSETEGLSALISARGGMVAALEEFRRTGEVSQAIIDRISSAVPGASTQVGELASNYLNLAAATDALATAEARLSDLDAQRIAASDDLAAAQASGDAGLIAAARNRQVEIKQRQEMVRQQVQQAKKQQAEAESTIKRQEQILDVQRQQVELIQRLAEANERLIQTETTSGGGGGGRAKVVDEVAEAQWRYAYATGTTVDKLEMLRQKQAQYGKDSKEYWELQTQIAQLQEQRNREIEAEQKQLEDTQKKAEREAKAEEERQQRVADAQWDYNYSIADTATRLDMLRERQQGYTQDSEEYWRLAQQIADTEEQLRKEQEAAAKAKSAGGGAGAGAGAGGGPGGPDIGAMIRENVEKAKADALGAGQALGELVINGVRNRVQERADAIRTAIAAALGQAGQGIQQAFGPVLGPVSASFEQLRGVVVSVLSTIGGGWVGLRLAMMGVNLPAIFMNIVGVVRQVWTAFTTGPAIFQGVLGSLRTLLMGLFSPVNLLIVIGAALGTAWANNFGGIRESVAGALAAVWTTITTIGGQILLFWQTNGSEILAFAGQTWNQISSIVGTVVSILMLVIGAGLTTISGFISTHSAEIQLFLSGAWQVIQGLVSGALGFIQGIVAAVLSIIQGDWSGAWTNIQNACASFVSGVWNMILGFLNMIAAFFGTSLSEIGTTWSNNWNAMVTLAGQVWERIKLTVTTYLDAARAYIESVLSALSSWWGTTWGTIATTAGNVWSGLVSAAQTKFGELSSGISTAIDGILTWIGDQVGKFTGLGGDLIMGMVDGVVEKAKNLAKAVIDAVKGALGAGQGAAQTGSPSRLFRRELGNYIGDGTALGVVDRQPAAVKAMEDMVGAMAAVTPDPINLPAVAGVRAAGGVGALVDSGAAAAQERQDRLFGLLEQLITTLSNTQPTVTVGPNTISTPLDAEILAQQVARVIQRKRQ